MADILGKTEDSQKYEIEAKNVGEYIRNNMFDKDNKFRFIINKNNK